MSWSNRDRDWKNARKFTFQATFSWPSRYIKLPSNALRNNCGAHFGSRFLLVSQVVNWNTQNPAEGLLCRGTYLPIFTRRPKKQHSPANPATYAGWPLRRRESSELFVLLKLTITGLYPRRGFKGSWNPPFLFLQKWLYSFDFSNVNAGKCCCARLLYSFLQSSRHLQHHRVLPFLEPPLGKRLGTSLNNQHDLAACVFPRFPSASCTWLDFDWFIACLWHHC